MREAGVAGMAGILAMTLAVCVPADSGEQSHEQLIGKIALQPIDDCDQVLTRLKQRAMKEMRERLARNRAYTLEWDRCADDYGASPFMEGLNFLDAGDGTRSETGAPPGESSDQGASQYSETNTQVAGVDEADFLKNDGAYIYILANGELQIVDAWPAAEARVLSRTPIEGTPRKLYVVADRAFVYSSLEELHSGDEGTIYDDGRDCVHGYDCDFAGDGRRLKMTLLDLSDRTRPVVLRESWLGGSYVSSRRIGTVVHTAVLFPPAYYPDVRYWPDTLEGYWTCDKTVPYWEVVAAFSALEERNKNVIEGTDITHWMPALRDVRLLETGPISTEEGVLQSCQSVYEAGLPQGQSYLSLFSMDLTELVPFATTTVVGKPGAVYATSGALYVSSRNTDPDAERYRIGEDPIGETSTVHKFELHADPPGSTYAGSGLVKGRVLNQFSMDELDGFLRIASTTGQSSGPGAHSTVSVLEMRDGALVVVGAVDDIAPGEDIRSVRFHGEAGFVVTFKKTDPLFALDLSDPTAPRIAGELEIPGFSTYLHLFDEDHLLTIGYDTDDQGSFAWFQGIMLQLFDVSDLSQPWLLYKEVIGTRGSGSDAALNHLAFNYFAPRNLLALPITICENGTGGSYGNEMTFSGLRVYHVSLADGFVLQGEVSHLDPASVDNHGALCGSWWTEAESTVKRSIFMDDFVYSIALDRIKVQHLEQLGEDVASVSLTGD